MARSPETIRAVPPASGVRHKGHAADGPRAPAARAEQGEDSIAGRLRSSGARLIEQRDQFIASRTDTTMHEGEIEGSRGFKSSPLLRAVRSNRRSHRCRR
jgi:hypothetical protein